MMRPANTPPKTAATALMEDVYYVYQIYIECARPERTKKEPLLLVTLSVGAKGLEPMTSRM